MIRFEQVSKAYLGGRQALQGVNFHLQSGEMAFLTGHSGAGKSTLLKLICGIERPSAGKILFGGHDISRLKSREVPFLRRQIGMIFQDQFAITLRKQTRKWLSRSSSSTAVPLTHLTQQNCSPSRTSTARWLAAPP